MPQPIEKTEPEMPTPSVEQPSPAPAFNPEIIADDSFIIDLHNDTLSQIHKSGRLDDFDGEELECSWPRLKAGGVKAAIFAIWIYKDQNPAVKYAMMDIFDKIIERHENEMAFAGSFKDVQQNLQAGKFSALLAIEGGHVIGRDLTMLEEFYKRGVRYMTITWKFSNQIADAAEDVRKPNQGLSDFGEKVIRKMNELGMIVDLSHSSDEAVADVLAISSDPVIASHSDCYALRAVPRNLKDDLIRGICGSRGVIGVNFHRPFLTGKARATVEDVVDHIDHVKEIGGIDCLALGSDLDGNIRPAAGLHNMSELPNLTAELKKRGYTAEEIKKIYGLNFLRVLRQVVDN